MSIVSVGRLVELVAEWNVASGPARARARFSFRGGARARSGRDGSVLPFLRTPLSHARTSFHTRPTIYGQMSRYGESKYLQWRARGAYNKKCHRHRRPHSPSLSFFSSSSFARVYVSDFSKEARGQCRISVGVLDGIAHSLESKEQETTR